SALNYGSIAAIAAAGRALKDFRPELSAKSIALAKRIWDEEHSHAPDLYSHGNTTGGPIDAEEFNAGVELLIATGDKKYADRVAALLPAMIKRFPFGITTAIRAIPHMPASYKAAIRAAIIEWQKRPPQGRANPYGVPITEGGWAGNGLIVALGITDYAIHRAFPDLSNGDGVFRSLDYLHGTHPGSDISFVSGVGTVSKEVAYGSNRADFSYIAGGVVPGVLIIKPDLPENSEQWPFFWGENEYVVNLGPSYIALVHAANDVASERSGK
ncbi:MAG: glycoside hydrolase, partial [Sphingomonas sp.]